jgi:hypothetical protein
LTAPVLMIACLVLAALIGCLAAAVARRTWLWAAGVIVLSALWPVVNHPLKGPVLWVVSAGHGLTVADLAAPVCLGVRIWLLRRALAARRIAQPRAADRSTP